MRAVASLGPRVSRRLATREAAEEGLERAVQAGEHVLQDLRVDRGVCGKRGLEVWQLGLLLGGAERDAAPLLGRLALFECGIVARATAPHGLHELALLFGRRLELVRELVWVGFVHRLYTHTLLDCARVCARAANEAIRWR